MFHLSTEYEYVVCRVVRIDPLRFLAGFHTRRLNQTLSVLSLRLDFFKCVFCAVNYGPFLHCVHWLSLVTICGDACPLSCVSAEACFTSWPNAQDRRDGEVNPALLSLINEACVSVCCSTLLLSQLVGPACVQARSSNPRGRACGPSGKGSGEEGILSGVVPVCLYCPAFNVSVSLGV